MQYFITIIMKGHVRDIVLIKRVMVHFVVIKSDNYKQSIIQLQSSAKI